MAADWWTALGLTPQDVGLEAGAPLPNVSFNDATGNIFGTSPFGSPYDFSTNWLGLPDDIWKLLGAVGAPALGAVASSNQAGAYSGLADKYLSLGAPARSRYEASFAPGFTMANEPGYKDALDQTTKSFLAKASVAGNPAESPNAWMQTLKDVNSTFAFPALQQYRAEQAAAGGMGATPTSAAAGFDSSKVGQQGNIYNAVGAGAANIFSPPERINPGDLEALAQLKSLKAYLDLTRGAAPSY